MLSIRLTFGRHSSNQKGYPFALISGEVMLMARKRLLRSNPITVALCGSQRMTCAPISINLSVKNSLLSNIFLMDQHASSCLSSHHQYNTHEVRCKSRPWRIINGHDRTVYKRLYLIYFLSRNVNIISFLH